MPRRRVKEMEDTDGLVYEFENANENIEKLIEENQSAQINQAIDEPKDDTDKK